MGRTIIQPIGPLYGEAVNGTVYGRPNGSIFVPLVNRITLSLPSEYITLGKTADTSTSIYPATNTGTIIPTVTAIAESQDNAAYMALQVSDDSDFETVDQLTFPAGSFNSTRKRIAYTDNVTITDGSTYYVRAVLYAASGVAVAYSDSETVTAVIPE